MSLWILIVGALVFASISTVTWMLMLRLWPSAGLQRLEETDFQRAASAPRWSDRLPPQLLQALGWLSQWSLSAAPGAEGASGLGTRSLGMKLVQAGWRSRHAIWLFGGAKTVLLAVLPLLLAPLTWPLGLDTGSPGWWSLLLAAAGVGYLLPDLVLRWQLARRKQMLFRAFPDALDLLRVCVQAGLGLDAAISRVGREMRLSSPILSEEWRLTGLELRAGASRGQALRHMADRVGLPDIDAMVTMLIQADRFGTRMADALQVHADALRTQRRLRAEEAAAKLPVKLLIPLIFCIFPALLTVMLGPAGISLYHHFSGQG
jgi:tight adherence protein C